MQYSIFTATQAVMFFGTPHRGLLTEDILSMVYGDEHMERAQLVESINRSSQDLQTQLEDFIAIAAAGRFKIFSFYETKKSRKLVRVSRLPLVVSPWHPWSQRRSIIRR
jgi:hypothetical protein